MQKTKFNKFLEKLEKGKLQNKIIALVIFIVILYLSFFGVHYVGKYIEINEVNNGRYTEILTSELTMRVVCFFVFFLISYIIIYIQNIISKILIKKVAKKENVKIGKLPNKSLALLASIIFGFIASKFISKDLLIYINTIITQDKDPIFNKSISYYILQRPFIFKSIRLISSYFLFNIVYIIGYYIAAFGYYFKGLSNDNRKKSGYVKHIIANIILFCVINIMETFLYKESVLFTKLNLNNDSLFSSLMGSGFTDINIKLWYFRLLPYMLLIGLALAIFFLVKKKYKSAVALPVMYVVINVVLYITTGIVQNVYVRPNELSVEKKYMQYHLDYTKKAYNIKTNNKDIYVDDNIEKQDLVEHENIIDNIDMLDYKNTLQELNAKEEKFYGYASIDTIVKEIDNKKSLLYLAPKEINSKNLEKEDYINRYIKYTHGDELKVYKQNIKDGKLVDLTSRINISNPEIYYGLLTDSDCIVNSNNDFKEEDMQDVTTVEKDYTGDTGISMRKLNRVVMSLKHLDYKFLMSEHITEESKFLINRNIVDRIKLVLPNMLIDNKPYMVIGEDNKQYYIVDAYTVSSNYPYSKKINIDKNKLEETEKFNLDSQNINYIRNSVKIVVNPYDGKLNIFNTDKDDIISRTYNNMYPNLFDKIEGNEVYEAVKNYLKYPKSLMDIQLDVLKEYYVSHAENFYKNEKFINISTYIDETNTKTELTSYYTLAKLIDKPEEEYILMQPVVNTQNKLTGYFSGTVKDGKNVLDFYSVTNANTVLSPMLLDEQVLVEDTELAAELEKVKANKNKISKKVLVIPIDNKLLNIQIYFTTPTEWTKESRIYKVIVSDGKKIAVSKTLDEALAKMVNLEENDFISDDIIKNDLYSNIEQVLRTYDYVKNSMKQGEIEVFGREMKNLEEDLNKLKTNYNIILEEKKK